MAAFDWSFLVVGERRIAPVLKKELWKICRLLLFFVQQKLLLNFELNILLQKIILDSQIDLKQTRINSVMRNVAFLYIFYICSLKQPPLSNIQTSDCEIKPLSTAAIVA